MHQIRYDSIGQNYSTTRHEDPFIRSRILSVLGEVRIVVNVGAGTGSYEPRDRTVLSVEPNKTMVLQCQTHIPHQKFFCLFLALFDV